MVAEASKAEGRTEDTLPVPVTGIPVSSPHDADASTSIASVADENLIVTPEPKGRDGICLIDLVSNQMTPCPNALQQGHRANGQKKKFGGYGLSKTNGTRGIVHYMSKLFCMQYVYNHM